MWQFVIETAQEEQQRPQSSTERPLKIIAHWPPPSCFRRIRPRDKLQQTSTESPDTKDRDRIDPAEETP